MPPRPFQHLLVLCLAAWMSMCCCEKRMLAQAFADAPEAAPSCCGGSCCGNDGDAQPSTDRDHRQGGCCADGCCAKAAPHAPSFDVAVDAVGVPMLAVLVVREATVGCARELAYEDGSVGEPPPRLALLISRRLRI